MNARASTSVYRLSLVDARAAVWRIPEPRMSPDCDVQIQIFGRLTVARAGTALPPVVGAPAALLRLIATLGAVHVDEIIEALWPEASADSGRTRLRNVLSRLRNSCGDVLVRVGATVAVADGVVVDLAVFDALARRSLALESDDPEADVLAKRALVFCEQVLLPEDVYRDWAAAPREQVRRRRLALLDLLAERAAARGDVRGAELRWLEAIEIEPFDEARYVAAARTMLGAGRWGTAHRLLQRAEVAMSTLGLPVTPELLNLRRALSTSATG